MPQQSRDLVGPARHLQRSADRETTPRNLAETRRLVQKSKTCVPWVLLFISSSLAWVATIYFVEAQWTGTIMTALLIENICALEPCHGERGFAHPSYLTLEEKKKSEKNGRSLGCRV